MAPGNAALLLDLAGCNRVISSGGFTGQEEFFQQEIKRSGGIVPTGKTAGSREPASGDTTVGSIGRVIVAPDLAVMTPQNAPPRDRTPRQELAEAALAKHPYRLELRGSPKSLAWPPICANCAGPGTERIRVRKAFSRRTANVHASSHVIGFSIVAADIPFCAACAERHRQAVKRMTPLGRLRTFLLTPVHIATIGLAVVLVNVLPSVLRVPIGAPGSLVAWGLAGALALGLLWTLGLAWLITRPDRLEPRTDVSLACDFSEDVSGGFERERHIYSLRNQAFADAVARANRDRVWTEDDQSRMRRHALVALIVLLLVLGTARMIVWYYGGE